MSEIVPTLFGLSPQAFQQQRQQQSDAQALALAQLDPFQRASFGIQQGANRLAGAIGGMLGGQDPELERRTQAHQIMGMIDPSDPDTFLRAAEMALQGGDQQLAFGLRQEGEKARQQFLIRQDAETKRTQEAQAMRRQQEARNVGQGAFVPSVPEQEQFVQIDEQGQPVAIPGVPASFDVNRVQNQLLGMGPEGQAELERLVAAQKLTRPEEIKVGATDRVLQRGADGTLKEVVSAAPPKPGITTRPLTKAEAKSLGLPADKSYQIDSTGKISQIGGGGVNVQVGPKGESLFGPIGQGMERYVDENGVVRERPVPGSAQDVERMRDAAKAKGREEQTALAGGTVVQDLQRALTSVLKNPGVTGRSAVVTLALPKIVGAETEAQAVAGYIESALSNIGLDTLQAMRTNSESGGALGQVPFQQQKRLEQVLGSLDQTQKKEIVADNLKRVINIYMDTIHGTQDEINQLFENGNITEKQKEEFGFRHKLSFDEFGNPIGKPGRANAPLYTPTTLPVTTPPTAAPRSADDLVRQYANPK